jgi:hypothetical protein
MKGFGVELWTMREGKIAIWEATFNSAPADQSMPLFSAPLMTEGTRCPCQYDAGR